MDLFDGILNAIRDADLGIYQTVGVLEAIKFDLLDIAKQVDKE